LSPISTASCRRCAVEPRTAYVRLSRTGQEITWGELDVGSRRIFAAAGFAEVSHPTLRRVVMRLDF
jgi:hypothetical protein